MRLPDFTLPAAFVKQDTRTNAADSFANARDFNRLRENHNMLLARRLRRTVLAQVFNTSDSTADGAPFIFKAYKGSLSQTAGLLYSATVLISQHTKELTIKIRAAKTDISTSTFDDDNDISVFCTVRKPFAPRELNAGLELTVTAASGSPAAYTGTISLPSAPIAETYWNGRQAYTIDVYGICLADTNDLVDDAEAVIGAGPDWIDAGTGTVGASAGDLIYLNDGSNTWPPRIIVKKATASGNDRLWVDRNFELPADDSWTFSTRLLLGLEVSTISIYEEAVSDFFAIKGFQ